MIARPSHGGERKSDSHPTPGPPTVVQSARAQLPCLAGTGAAEQPGGCPSPGEPALPFADRPVETDLGSGAWIAASLETSSESGASVAALVPPLFAAYARVFHPAVRYAGDDDVEVCWAAVATANGTQQHPLMQWGSLTGSLEYFSNDDQAPLWHGAPARGHLPASVAERLTTGLRRHTGTPDDCWFGVWTGHGNPAATAPALALPRGAVWLVRGPIELAAANLAEEPGEQSANLFWPADRAWYVATDADLVTTYVGGTAECIGGLLATEGLEAALARSGDPVGWDADRVNPLPPDGPPLPGGR